MVPVAVSGVKVASTDANILFYSGPVGFVSLVIFFLAWPKSEQLPSTARRSWKEFDYVGSFLIIPAAVLAVYAFQNEGVSAHTSWGTAGFIVPLTISLILWLALFAWGYVVGRFFEGRVALTFPISLFRNRAYATAAISTLFLGFPYFILNYALPLRAQVVSEKNALVAGVMLLPMLGSSAVGTIIAGFASRKKNYIFETMLIGACLMTLGVGLLTMIHDSGDDSKALGFIVFVGLGFGLTVASATMQTSYEVSIVDYGNSLFLSTFIFQIKLMFSFSSTCSGNYCTVANSRRQLGHIYLDCLPQQQNH